MSTAVLSTPLSAARTVTQAAGNHKILIANADCASAAELVVAASALGFHAGVCNDGSSLIEQTKKIIPDIVFIDTELPRTDAGSVIRVLQRFPGTRAVVVILMVPSGTDTSKLARAQALGAFRVVSRTIHGQAMVDLLDEAQEEAERLKHEHHASDDAKVCATRHVPGNNSLLARKISCPFHDSFVALDRFVLRTGRILTDQTFFDLPVYIHAAPKCDFINYHLLAVAVCPKCFFATNEPSYFHDPSEKKLKLHHHSQPTRDMMISRTAQRVAIASRISSGFFTEQRTVADALISYDLAISASEVILTCNRHALPLEHLRLANYHLRIAHLMELSKASAVDVKARAVLAMDGLKQAFLTLEGGGLLKATYQLVALTIALGDDKSAYQYITRLTELSHQPSANSDDCAAMERYLAKSKSAWENREAHRFAPM